MDVSELLDNLNKPQREAVTAPLGPARIIAGAGSGKTRVLVHRIAWLIKAESLAASHILAVTFTNKAATEMRNKIEHVLGSPTNQMWIGTFHSLAHRLLRLHWQDADLPQDFQILDSDDQKRLLKRTIRDMNLDEEKFSPNRLSRYINAQKDEGLRAKHIEASRYNDDQTMLAIYQQYENTCARSGLVDFGELLLRCYELWLKKPDNLSRFRQRFQQILVDEFQDTNSIQYAWLKLLAGDTGHLFIVGDDDQSIYGWRGARIENIQRFSEDYPNTTTVRLEQNYRSSGHILAAANAVIAHNTDRLGKKLWTHDDDGEAIQIYCAYHDRDEADYIIRQIKKWTSQGERRQDCAVLYRSNAQSRIIEEELVRANVPYRIYGGLRFFERAEIKDVLAYLRLIANKQDDAAFERVVNTPPRGIGMATLNQLRQYAQSHRVTMWQAASALIKSQHLSTRQAHALTHFLTLIDSLTAENDALSLDKLTALVIDKSGLRLHFSKDTSEKGQARLDNIDELINAARQFVLPDNTDNMPLLNAFLSHAALEAGDNQGEQWQDCVQLMTLHSAKGLEFPVVFIAGMEEGLFPSKKTSDDPTRLAEERRLCYVGMTRAQRQLYLLYTESRFLYGQHISPRPSRFLKEIPPECAQQVRPQKHITHVAAKITADDIGFNCGQRVHHHKFGMGTIIDTEGSGKAARVQVDFKHAGHKWLVLAYAKLEIM